jgi:hypothetical protein
MAKVNEQHATKYYGAPKMTSHHAGARQSTLVRYLVRAVTVIPQPFCLGRAVAIPALLAFVCFVSSTRPARCQFEELTRRVPSSANVVAFVNVEKLMASPVAIKEKWSEKRDTAFASGVSFLPPDAKQAVLAMHVDLQMWLPLWESAILELDHEPDVDKVVQVTGGSSDAIGGYQAVALQGAYLLKFGKSTAAFMAPANRQTIARWMNEMDANKGIRLSPYLSEAYSYANGLGTPVILALDLEDAIPLAEIKTQLQNSEDFLAQHKLDIDQVSKTLSGIRGVTLGITFDQKPFGKVKVDFRDTVTMPPELAKAALIHALGNHGAMIDEFEDWKPAVVGKQITLEGFLTNSGMQRLSSLFDRPPSLKVQQSPAGQTSKSKEQLIVQTSQAYFKQITGLLDDLKQEKKQNPRYTMAQIGVWMDKYATKIDQLSVLNVDPDLVRYSMDVSDALRDAYGAIRGGAARSRIRQVNTSVPQGFYSDGTTTYGYTYREGQRIHNQEQARVRTEERVVSASSARDIIANINAATGEIRRKMTQKYQADF